MTKRIFRTILSLVALTAPLFATAYSTSYYTTKSVLAEGKWVKIKVSETGIHQISHDTLKELGFADPSAVVVYGYGGARLTSNAFASDLPDDLSVTPVYHTSDGRMLFYGEADLSLTATSTSAITVRRNLYGTDAYYFLTDSHSALKLPSPLKTAPSAEASDTHLSVWYVENEVQNPSNGGAIFHDTPFGPGDVVNYDFDICDFNSESTYSSGTLGYSFAVYASRNTSLETILPSGLSISKTKKTAAGLQTQDTKYYSVGSGSMSVDNVSENGTYTIGFKLPDDITPNYAAMDYAWLVYPRYNRMSGPSLEMHFPGMDTGAAVSISNCKGQVMVWDISDAASVTPCQVYYNGSTVTAICPVTATKQSVHRLIAFDTDEMFPEAEVCGEIENQNLHGEDVPEMVIITTEEFKAAAEQLADIHRKYDKMVVRVVTQEKIFNEFSSGGRAAMGYRRYLKMLYDRQPKTFKYLLLYGQSNKDNRRKVSREELVCYETENVDHSRDLTKNFTSDKYFVMLENSFNASQLHFGIMSVAVGRIAPASVSEAEKINAKIERFITRGRGHDVYGNILVLSDDGDNQEHFIDAEHVISTMAEENSTLTYTRIHNLIYPWEDGTSVAGRKAISNALKYGQGLFFYAGHCSPAALTGERLYDANLIGATDYDNYPFAMLATCETFGFDRNALVLGPSMLNKDNGGAIAIIGSCRSVYMEYNRTLAAAVGSAYASANSKTTIGDISRNAHNYCIRTYTENDRAANNLCYNLCGDPALRVGAPDASVVIDAVDGQTPGEDTTIELQALKPFVIEGHIVGVRNSFKGKAIVRVYDNPYTVKTNERTSGEDKTLKYDVTLDEKIIAEKCIKVSGTRFKAEITVPEATPSELLSRITVSIISDDKTLGAVGVSDGYKINQHDGISDIDTSAPEITEMYINTPSFDSGDISGNSIVLYATINVPSSGLKLSNAFGSGAKLMLDNRTSYPSALSAIELNPDGTASLVCPITNLTDGHHELTLSLASVTGTSVSRTIGFTIRDTSINCKLDSDSPIARDGIEFTLNHDFNAEPSGRIVIEDAQGATIFSADDCTFPYQWDLRANNGDDVPDGHYRAYGILRDELNYSSTPVLEFTVIR